LIDFKIKNKFLLRIILIIVMKKNRTTNQRKIILEELRKVHSHPTAQQIHAMVNDGKSKISLATVYRTLEYLENRGLIIKLKTKEKEARYDGNSESHCHLICKKCSHVQDIHDITNIFVNSKSLEDSKFQVHYDFFGTTRTLSQL